jgi:hypothetical protein
MPGIPEQRQSVRPSGRVLLGVLCVFIALLVVWFAVGAAVDAGGEDCPAQNERGAVSDRCR